MSRFSYVRYDDESARIQQEFKAAFENLENMALTYFPNCRTCSLLLTKLEEAYMWTGKAIRDIQIKKDGTVVELTERNNE